MQPKTSLVDQLSENDSLVVFTHGQHEWTSYCPDQKTADYVRNKLADDADYVVLNLLDRFLIFLREPKGDASYKKLENLRKKAHELYDLLNKEKIKKLHILPKGATSEEVLAFAEGLMLSGYQFLKYKPNEKKNSLKEIVIAGGEFDKTAVDQLNNVVEATCIARDLVNEPVIYLTAEQLSKDLEQLGKEAGFEVEVLHETRIQTLKMGGLLAVNEGSPNPPTFNILEYKPENAINERPFIMVGKGVVYDTGGLSLKSTPQSMDMMKSDMAGAASVIGAFYAAAKSKLPVYMVGLIPATDNRPGGNALTPGDVITMHSGKTVEVKNTDAEGRLILADALSYAKKYNPQLVVDLATLTGAAAKAIGIQGIVYMGTANEETKKKFSESGYRVHERLVEFPLWEKYDRQLKSDIAELSNLGGPNAGAITAGMFLKHFTSYDWLHFDIAGTAFLTNPDSYRGKNGTGTGVRLLFDFIKGMQ
jgi:leucyl aminopeptidase